MENPFTTDPVFRVLFVCMGNICRSPAAEIIFRKFVSDEHLDVKVVADSAGTIGYHQGDTPDRRMLKALEESGYSWDGHRARKIEPEDLERFDLLLTMDDENLKEVRSLDVFKRFRDKIVPMCTFVKKFKDREVPDPYYGGSSVFFHVIHLLEDGCANLLDLAKSRMQTTGNPE